MFSFLKKTKEEQTICLCVLTGATVIGSVVRTYQRRDAVTEPIVLFSCEEEISAQYGDDQEILMGLTQKAMMSVLEKCRMHYGSCDEMKCVIGEPWTTTKYRTVTLEKNAPFVVTQKIVHDAIDRDMRLFEQEVLRDFKEEVAIIDITKPAVSVNGYRTHTWEKKSLKKIEIAQTISLAPIRIIEMIMAVYADVFHSSDVGLSAYSHSIAQSLPSTLRNQTVMVLSGVSIDFYTVDQGLIIQSLSYPGGVFETLQTLGLLFDVPQHRIATIFNFAHDENILEHYRDRYVVRLTNSYTELGLRIQKNILQLKKQGMICSDPVMVITHYAWMPLFQVMIERDLGYSVVLPEMNTSEIIYTHDAKVRDNINSIAIRGILNE